MPRPDEGLIHAWLDGQLLPEEAARIEELAATDPEWAAAVAEARGLVAAASRILSALDRVPAGVVPKGTAARTTRLPWWTKVAAGVVVVVGGSIVVMQNAPEGRMSALSTEQAAQPTPDTQKSVVEAPVTSPPVPAKATPGTTARVPAAVPASAPAPSVSAIVAEERKVVQDAERVVAELSAAKSLVAKAAPSAASSIAPRAAPQAPQATTQDLAQAQNAVPAQRVAGGVIAARSAHGQQIPLCYRLVPDSARSGTAIIMRAVRAAGDTLHLVPVESNVPQRAWIVWRDRMTGLMTTSGDLRNTVRIVATPAMCPAP